jgi:hypothetical protein
MLISFVGIVPVQAVSNRLVWEPQIFPVLQALCRPHSLVSFASKSIVSAYSRCLAEFLYVLPAVLSSLYYFSPL